MVLCTEESPLGSDPNSQAVTITHAEGSTEEAPHSETKQMTPDSRAPRSQSDCERDNPSATPPERSKGSDKDSSPVQSVQDGKNTIMISEGPLLPSPKWPPCLPPGQGGSTNSGKSEKASEDGYNWRKYGQKNVKGNESIRSYYRCTHPKCPVKKQVERSLKGQIIDTAYFGQHDHPKPHISVPQAISLVVAIVEEKPENPSSTVTEEKPSEVRGQTCQQLKKTDTTMFPVVTASNDVQGTALLSAMTRLRDEVDNDDDPNSKRKKKENHGVDAAAADKATGEARLIIQTMSEVDIVNDGYRWRKYGQKLVKGNPNPRSYYRCSSPGCPVKKHVERTSHDPKVVMTTYEGQHDHDMPAARTVTCNPAGNNGATIAHNDEARIKSEEGEAVSADAASGKDSSNSHSKLTEQQNGKSENKCDVTKTSTPECEGKPSEQQKVDPSSHRKSQGERASPTGLVPQGRLTEEQPNIQLTAKPEEGEGVSHNKVGKTSNEQQQVLNSAAPVQC